MFNLVNFCFGVIVGFLFLRIPVSGVLLFSMLVILILYAKQRRGVKLEKGKLLVNAPYKNFSENFTYLNKLSKRAKKVRVTVYYEDSLQIFGCVYKGDVVKFENWYKWLQELEPEKDVKHIKLAFQ